MPASDSNPYPSLASTLPLMVCVSDAPRIFGMSRVHTYRLRDRGLIEMVKMGHKTMIKTESMLAYINSLPLLESGSP